MTVLDEGDPLLVLPDDLVVEATGAAGATVPFDATATDDVDPDPSVVCTPASGDLFPLGSTDVSCTATDNDDNATAGTFNVTVADSTAPTLDLPDDITVEASAPTGASVEFDVTAADAVDPDPVVACTPPSGDEFAVGTTTVHCTATDAAGNTGSGEFSVTVTDSTGPTLDLPDDIEVTASGPDGAVVTYEATAQDSVGGDVPVDCQPPSGSLFPVGTTVVTCTATDNPVVPAGFYGYVRAISQIDPGPGNVTTGTFTVTVRSAAPTPDSPSTTTGGTPTTTPAGALPATGVPSTGVTLIAALILMAGAGLLGVAGLNRQRHER
ncbi:HYR domain-containing protein [Desertimonas flava]|uniref:HYR domain-containing protein n=1 Tax=Desertimonas flava TaxID=2064846 RepID=UPI001F09F357|nr:HYR domain-containing protein [Desertimonas flava]